MIKNQNHTKQNNALESDSPGDRLWQVHTESRSGHCHGNNDATTFGDRVTEVNEVVEVVPSEEAQTNLTATSDLEYVLKLIVDIKPPSINSLSVQADAISVNSKGVAVAYNVAGDTQSGAIDIFELSGAKVTLKSELKYATRDVNGLFWADKYLYAVGADSAGTAHSYLSRIKMDGNNLSDKITETNLVGYAGTGVYSTGSLIYTTSGDNGEVASFEPTTLAKKSSAALFDARALGYSASSGQMFALSGQPGTLTTLSKAEALVSSKKLGGAATAQSKSTIQVGDAMSLVSLGEGGFAIVCNADGTIEGSAKVASASLSKTAKAFTNGASMYKNLVFTANGEGGVFAYLATPANPLLPTTKCQPITLSQVGYLKLDDSLSANAVVFRDGHVIIASGNGGLKVVSVDIPSTLPSVIGGESNDTEGFNEK